MPEKTTQNTIPCPNCFTKIPIDKVLRAEIAKDVAEKMKQPLLQKEKQLKMQEQAFLEEKRKQDTIIKQKIESQKREMWEKAQKAAKEASEKNMKDLQAQNDEKNKKLEEYMKQELELRKKARELEEKDKNRELEMQRKLDEETKKLKQGIEKGFEEENRKKMAEKDKQLEQLQKTIADLKRKSEQGSMQIQGDAQEEALKQLLQTNFAFDDILDVATGVRGADLVQKVKNMTANVCGTVLWESKSTKNWTDSWISKLKQDQGNAKADIAILVTATLPKDVTNFTQINGIWVTNFAYALPIITAIRFHLIELERNKRALAGKDEKMQFLYEYLAGPQFKNRVENIVEAFTAMKTNLDQEKRAMNKLWARREKEIERVVINTTGMYGDLQGIIGASLPTITRLELPDEFLE